MSRQKSNKDKDSKLLRNAANLSGIALQMGATIYLGNLFGTWLDATYKKSFWEDTITLLAVFLSMYLVIRKVMALNK